MRISELEDGTGLPDGIYVHGCSDEVTNFMTL